MRKRRTPAKPLISYHVWYANGDDHMIYLPKMSKAKTEEVFRMDAKSDGTELKGYRILNIGI